MITETEIVQFMREAVERLAQETKGCGFAHVTLQVQRHGDGTIQPPVWTTYVHENRHIDSDTLDASIAKQVEASSPAVRITYKRERAAELLAEANAIERAMS